MVSAVLLFHLEMIENSKEQSLLEHNVKIKPTMNRMFSDYNISSLKHLLNFFMNALQKI